MLLAQHGITLSEQALEGVTRRAEGWAAVMRMAAMSMGGHSDPEQFAKELVAEDGAVTGYLVEEVLNAQPAQVRNFLLRTSILDRMNEDVASELAGARRSAVHLADLARVNPLVQRDDSGWYRYHPLFASVLRLKLRCEYPDRLADLHLRAAAWYRRTGALSEAVQQAADAGDWQFAARTVIDELAVGLLLDPPDGKPLRAGFRHMPRDASWVEPQPLLVAAAIDFAEGRDGSSDARLGVADSMLANCPAEQEIPSRLAASLVRLALSRRAGDFDAAVAAVDQARILIEAIPPGQPAWHPEIRARVLSGHGAVELWSGRFDEAAALFGAGASAASSTESESERADCLGYLALIEVLLGRLNGGVELAAEAMGSAGDDPVRPAAMSLAAEVARAFAHLERNELPDVHLRLKHVHDALRARPDKLIGAVACMAAARCALAEGRGKKASEIIGRARQDWSPPAWIQHRLMLLDSWAYTATADYRSAIDTATRAGAGSSLDATAALARTLLAAGDPQGARHALAGVPLGDEAPGSGRLAARMVDAQLGYASGDHARGRRSLEQTLRLAESEQLRLPFAMERTWIRPVLRRDPELGYRYRRLLEPGLISPGPVPAPRPGAGEAAPLVVEPLSEREHEVLKHVSAMESTAEIATEMYISVNTVKTHLKSIYRKLAAAHRGEAVRRARQLGLL
jgi:LuxR family maltose regulon positive regulatory protein